MNVRERVLATLSWMEVDYVPWVVKANHLPRGEWERELRNKGLGFSLPASVYNVSMPNVAVSRVVKGDYFFRVYETPVGSLREVVKTGLPSEAGERSDRWVVEHLVKDSRDYRVLEYLFEDMVFKPRYRDFRLIEEAVGGDGVVYTSIGYSPLMELIVNYMGFRVFAREFKRNPGKLESLLEIIHERKLEACKLVANSPAKIVLIGDNIDEVLVDPRLFRKYCLPYYREYADILKSSGKIVGSHMDGRLKSLKNLIAETGLDFIHGFTPPPGGNLSLREAREAWKSVLWVNIPQVIFYENASKIANYVRKLLEESGKRGLILGITETVPPEERSKGYTVILEIVLKYGRVN